MKILFITTSYEQKANSAAIRNNAWVTGLINNGLEVDVLTIKWPEFMRSEYLMSNNSARIIHSTLPELEALKLTKSKVKSHIFLKKAFDKLRKHIRDWIFFPDVCKNWKNKIKNFNISPYDVIISSSDLKSSHLAAYNLVKNSHKKWIQIWGDPWSTDINLNKKQQYKARKNEYKLLKLADAIVYVSEFTKCELQQLYPDLSSKMYYIPRGYYKKVNLLSDSTSKDQKTINIVYTGILSTGRNIEGFLNAISEYNKKASKQIILNLYGDYTSEQSELFNTFNWLKCHGKVDYSAVLGIYANADLLLFISNGKNSTQIPGKLFDYLGTTKPIICICSKYEKDLISFLKQYERCVMPEDTSHKSLIEMIFRSVEKIDNKYTPIEEFDPNNISGQLIKIIKKC